MYYDKKGRNRNIAVFKGKKAKYQKLVLEALLLGDKTTAEIARFIAGKVGVNYRHIRSVIDRKKGALRRLSQPGKAFIRRKTDQKWTLTLKGLATATLWFNNYEHIISIIKGGIEGFNTKDLYDIMTTIPLLKNVLSEKMLEEFVRLPLTSEFWEVVKRKTRKLVDMGLDLEDLPEKEFENLLLMQVITDIVNKKIFRAFTNKHRI